MIAIIEYKAGNTASVKNAVMRLGYDCIITSAAEELRKADKVILPGVGSAGFAMDGLKSAGLEVLLPALVQPVLGVCLGMQLFCNHSEEDDTDCLGIFDAAVRKFPPGDIVPHTGWNNITNNSGPLLDRIAEEADVYFVHSYYAEISEETISTCNYILPFSAAMQYKNFYATQFHPEKSGETGSKILENFLAL